MKNAIHRFKMFYDEQGLWLWYAGAIVLVLLILGSYVRVRQRWAAAIRVNQAMEAIEEYASNRGWTALEWRNVRGPGGGYEVVVDWKDDNSPRSCTLIIRQVDGEWKVTDEECQGS